MFSTIKKILIIFLLSTLDKIIVILESKLLHWYHLVFNDNGTSTFCVFSIHPLFAEVRDQRNARLPQICEYSKLVNGQTPWILRILRIHKYLESANTPNLWILQILEYTESANTSNPLIPRIRKYLKFVYTPNPWIPKTANTPNSQISQICHYPESGNTPNLQIPRISEYPKFAKNLNPRMSQICEYPKLGYTLNLRKLKINEYPKFVKKKSKNKPRIKNVNKRTLYLYYKAKC